jgi:LysR family transcriptional regulator, low CO2-responsive transcriptional regulator
VETPTVREVTLTQLKVFVLVARLGSVKGAATALGVSEPAVSQALTALRQSLGDQLLTRTPTGMELTGAGQRIVGIASQMVHLADEAEVAVRQSQGAPELLRVVATSTIGQAAAPALLQAFTARAGNVEVTLGIASGDEITALLHERLADVALGPQLPSAQRDGMSSEPLMRYRLTLVVGHQHRLATASGIAMRHLRDEVWLVDPEGTDPSSPVGQLLAHLAVAAEQVRVFPNQTAARDAAAEGAGVALVVDHLLQRDPTARLVRLPVAGFPLERLWYVSALSGERRRPLVGKLQRFLSTPEAMHAMHSGDGGVPAQRFKPPVYVTIWS